MVSAKVDSLQLVHYLSEHHFSGELRVEVSQRLERHSNEWVTLSWIGLGFRRRGSWRIDSYLIVWSIWPNYY